MLNVFVGFVLPPLLVFGLYHMLTWLNVFHINRRVYWKRVALASALSHTLLVTGFFVFSYLEYRASQGFGALGLSYGEFLFNRSEFWRLVTIFDTTAMVCILGLFSLLDRFGIELPGIVPMTVAITYLAGMLQWYFVGGGIGTALERFWSGLKTTEEEEEWFQ